MNPTQLQTLLGLDYFAHNASAVIEGLLVVAGMLAAFAVRRRKRAVTATTFTLLSVSLLIDASAHFMRGAAAEKVAVAAYVLFLFGAIRLILEGVDSASRRGKAHFSTIFKDIVMLLMWAVVLMIVMYTDFGVQPLSLLTGSAVVAAVVGFGLQETLGNIFSGLTIQMQKPFEPGDWVRSGDHLGRVRGIGWRSTTIYTRANERVEIPNALLAKDVLYNYATGHVRDEFTVGISYGVAPNQVREVALGLLHDVAHILRDPPPDVLASQFGDFSIEYRVRYWIADYGTQEYVRDLVMSRLWYALRRHSIEIPFPIRTLRMEQPRADERAAAGFEHQLMGELRRVPILHQLSEEELRVLVPTVAVRQFGAGEVLMRQGDEGETLYIIRSGTVEVLLRAEDGSNRHVANLGRAQFIGEAALLLGEPRNATIRAVTDVEVLEMDREGFTRLFKEHPDAAAKMSEVIAAREAERREVLAQAGGHDGTRGRRVWLFAKMREIFDF